MTLITTSIKTLITHLIQRYQFRALRKSYPWSAIGLCALRLPFTKDRDTRLHLYNRMHRAGMRLNFGELSGTIAETALPQYWIF
jgi:hypothetical protein